MTDPVAEPVGEPPAGPRPPHQRAPWLIAAGFLLLALAIGYVGLNPSPPADLSGIERQLAAIEARLTRLEQRPPANPDLSGLTARLDVLERRPIPDLAGLRTRLDGIEQRPPADPEALSARMAALEQAAARTGRLVRVQAAIAALAAGHRLGDIPGAPPAITRFAATPPPTEAGLRLAFPVIERLRPADDDRSFLTRVLSRTEGLVTIRQGDKVLVGDPAAGVLARAHAALDAGDLDAAITAISSLRGDAAAAVAGWLADATALRDARAALATLAERP